MAQYRITDARGTAYGPFWARTPDRAVDALIRSGAAPHGALTVTPVGSRARDFAARLLVVGGVACIPLVLRACAG